MDNRRTDTFILLCVLSLVYGMFSLRYKNNTNPPPPQKKSVAGEVRGPPSGGWNKYIIVWYGHRFMMPVHVRATLVLLASLKSHFLVVETLDPCWIVTVCHYTDYPKQHWGVRAHDPQAGHFSPSVPFTSACLCNDVVLGTVLMFIEQSS